VNAQIREAEHIAQRGPDTVRLIVVTKAQPLNVVQAAVAAGAKILGENYPEEALEKIAEVGKGVEWHMIGHLQSRKAGIVAQQFDVLHSLDSVRLAEKLERQLAAQERRLPVLLECNVGGEESKYGWPVWDEVGWEALLQDVEAILGLPHLQIRGLMTMPPLFEDPQDARPYFSRLRVLSERLGARFGGQSFVELSMGTSADFPAAVMEGATMVRVGSAIVGPRPAKHR
jgi:pyridoxal phosphate enzyme (YggS family)